MLKRAFPNMQPADVTELFDMVDADKTGSINFEQFLHFLKHHKRGPVYMALITAYAQDQAERVVSAGAAAGAAATATATAAAAAAAAAAAEPGDTKKDQ